MSTPSSPGHLEPAPCHLPSLLLGLPGPSEVLTCDQALLPDDFLPPGVHRASFDKRPPSQRSLHKVSPGTAHSPLQTGPPIKKSPSPYSGNLPSLGNPALHARVPESFGARTVPPFQGALTCSRGSRFHPIYPCGGQAARRLWSPV